METSKYYFEDIPLKQINQTQIDFVHHNIIIFYGQNSKKIIPFSSKTTFEGNLNMDKVILNLQEEQINLDIQELRRELIVDSFVAIAHIVCLLFSGIFCGMLFNLPSFVLSCICGIATMIVSWSLVDICFAKFKRKEFMIAQLIHDIKNNNEKFKQYIALLEKNKSINTIVISALEQSTCITEQHRNHLLEEYKSLKEVVEMFADDPHQEIENKRKKLGK